MNEPQELPRDVFIAEVMRAASRDRNLVFLCCDLGAKALDRFRAELPDQFVHTGISEQSTINIASGLAIDGKKVYVYAMTPFVTFRCFEQIKVSLASMNLPVTIVGVGCGYAYDDAGPTHYGTEDLGVMRSLCNIEIVTPSDTVSVRETARHTAEKPALRYVRLDRIALPTIYRDTDRHFIEEGFAEVETGTDVCLVAHGFMLHRAMEVREALGKLGISAGVVDLYRIKPVSAERLALTLGTYRKVVTIEEHFLSAGVGSVVLEALCDAEMTCDVKRFGIPDRYLFENGGRKFLHRHLGLDAATLTDGIGAFVRREAHDAGAVRPPSALSSGSPSSPDAAASARRGSRR